MNAYQQYQNTFCSEEIKSVVKLINQINFKDLGINEYNIDYIENMQPTLFYYFQMFDYSLQKLINFAPIKGEYIVDFGGGHGFLSLYLKQKGFKVIYCDFNPSSVSTIQKISQKIGFGPDYYIEGSYQELLQFIKDRNIKVDYLISTDTIEHIHDLDEMFNYFSQLNSSIKMLFTTASNPKNFIKAKRLRKLMEKDEIEEYCPKRKEYLKKIGPELTEKELELLANKSRGLRYVDLIDFLEYYRQNQAVMQVDVDQYNCCEPDFGSWMERILPLSDYHQLAKKYNFSCTIENGFYCDVDKKGFKKKVVSLVNFSALKTNQLGLILSPFITLKFAPK